MPVPVSSEETGAVTDVVVVSPSRSMRVMLVSRSAQRALRGEQMVKTRRLTSRYSEQWGLQRFGYTI